MSIVIDEKGQQTDEFITFTDELRGDLAPLLEKIKLWIKAHGGSPADMKLAAYEIESELNLQFIKLWMDAVAETYFEEEV